MKDHREISEEIQCGLCLIDGKLDVRIARSEINEHKQNVHNGVTKKSNKIENVFDCSDCDACLKEAAENKGVKYESEKEMPKKYCKRIKRQGDVFFSCLFCDIKTKTKLKIKWHGFKTHGWKDLEYIFTQIREKQYFQGKGTKHNFFYECMQCDEIANLKSYMACHILVRHTEKQNISMTELEEQRQYKIFRGDKSFNLPSFFLCMQCHFKANRENEMISHMKNMHKLLVSYNKVRRVFEERKNKKLQCEYCTFSTIYAKTLSSHMRYHRRNCFVCHLCQDQDFSTQRDLIYHFEKNHTVDEKEKCEKCYYTSFMKHYMKRHMKAVHGDKNTKIQKKRKYRCDLCLDYSTNQLQKFKRHFKEKKKRGCKNCDFKTHLRKEFLKHKAICEKTIHYTCQVCDMKFKRKNNMQSHRENRHTAKVLPAELLKAGKLICDMCNILYKNVRSFKTHMDKFHKLKEEVSVYEDRIFCDICNSNFKSKLDFRYHIKRKHNVKIAHVRHEPHTLKKNEKHIDEDIIPKHEKDLEVVEMYRTGSLDLNPNIPKKHIQLEKDDIEEGEIVKRVFVIKE